MSSYDFLLRSSDYLTDGIHYTTEYYQPLSSASPESMELEAVAVILTAGAALGYKRAKDKREEMEDDHIDSPPEDKNDYFSFLR